MRDRTLAMLGPQYQGYLATRQRQRQRWLLPWQPSMRRQ